MSDDENVLSEEMRAAFAAVELRAGFAERVMRAWLDEQASAATSRWRPSTPLVLATLTLVAAGTMLMVLLRSPVWPGATVRPPAVAAPAPLPAAAPTVAPRSSRPDTPDALYAEAGRRLAAHAWSDARRLYGAFVGLYPDDWRATRAQFQIGETYAGETRFAEAIGAYTKAIERAPESDVAADAMYKTGLAFTALKHCSDARVYFEQLLARHPAGGNGDALDGLLNDARPEARPAAGSAWKKDAEQQLRELARARNDKSRCID